MPICPHRSKEVGSDGNGEDDEKMDKRLESTTQALTLRNAGGTEITIGFFHTIPPLKE